MKWNGSLCVAPQVTFHVEEVSALTLCNLVPRIPDKGAKRLDQFVEHRDTNEGGDAVREASSAEVPHEEGLEEESMCEDESRCEDNREDVDDEDADDEDMGEESNSPGRAKQGAHQHHHPSHCVSRSHQSHQR